jgi:hypothetical protein
MLLLLFLTACDDNDNAAPPIRGTATNRNTDAANSDRDRYTRNLSDGDRTAYTDGGRNRDTHANGRSNHHADRDANTPVM